MRRLAWLLPVLAALALLPGAPSPAAATAAARSSFPTEILFQAFTWDAAVNGQKHVWWRHLTGLADELSQAGVTHVWFPPPSRSVSPQGYMPGDYYNLGSGAELSFAGRTLYGTDEELVACVDAYKRRGLVCVADVVLNHRCASHQDGAGNWNVYHHASGKMVWEGWALAKGDCGGSGAPDSGSDFAAAPDVDHTNPKVRADVVEWLRWLRSHVGFEGLRFDYAKGYGARYVKDYVEQAAPEFAVGEFWSSMDYQEFYLLPDQNAHRQKLVDWIDGTGGTACSFDFTTKGLLQEALKSGEFWRLRDKDGKAAGLLGWWPERSVTFIDNHDTGSTQGHWPFPGDKVAAGYAYLLTHPGVPSIFWDHYYAWGQELHDRIKELALLRHELGLNRSSKLEILRAEQGCYAARVDGKVVLVLGAGNEPDGAFKLRCSGPGYRVYVK